MHKVSTVVSLTAWALAAAAPAQVVHKTPTAAQYAALAQLPDWTGVWAPGSLRPSSAVTGAAPAYTPAAEKMLAAFKAGQAEGKNLQTDAANCVPTGMPSIMRMPYPMEILFTPDRVTIEIETYSQVRRIYTDGRPPEEDPDPAYNGWSTGKWNGDTLEVDTIGLNPQTSLVAGLHPTEQTKIHETIRLADPDKLSVTTTITDPALYTQPYTTTQTYVRKRDWQIREYVCQENNKDAADAEGRPSMKLD